VITSALPIPLDDTASVDESITAWALAAAAATRTPSSVS